MSQPSQIVKSVYKELINHFGEPDNPVRFGNGQPVNGEEHLPSFVDVFIWKSDEEVDINTFSTVGMSDKAMSGADFRSELHFSFNGCRNQDYMHVFSEYFCLSLYSEYPF
jgi:hypothetical protein